MTHLIEATVSTVQCEGEQHITPHLTLHGDTDMVTAGFEALSSITANEIVIAELDAEELRDEGRIGFQSRINTLLHRDDLRFLRWRRVEKAFIPTGLSFQDFQKAYSPSRVVFVCPKCDRDAVEVSTESPEEYERAGGKLIVLGNLKVRG